MIEAIKILLSAAVIDAFVGLFLFISHDMSNGCKLTKKLLEWNGVLIVLIISSIITLFSLNLIWN